jgi:2-keto-4-pentenoate hydratase/2-oxohepta-3-ene-1,7-dioic acid hydratase in catechol pathway
VAREIDGAVAVITMHRPHNLLDPALTQALLDALAWVPTTGSHAVILRSGLRHFSAAVIGRPGADIPVDEAEGHIAGYTILCDWSARDLQEEEMAQGLGPAKGKDSATTLGPWLVTPDELADRRTGKGFDLTATTSVNGELYSSGNWSTIYWSFAQAISYASRGTRLRTGDVIGSGTIGTGCILELSRVHDAAKYPWLKAGDQVRISVDGLGAIESTIQPPVPVLPL